LPIDQGAHLGGLVARTSLPANSSLLRTSATLMASRSRHAAVQ
jgi:hypothetical protein